MKIFFLGVFFLTVVYSETNNLWSEDQLKKLANSSQWRGLLHFKSGSPQSEIKDKQFFLSAKGSEDPFLELVATIEAVNSDRKIGFLGQSPVCAFPARYLVLKQQLGIRFSEKNCDKWEIFYQRFEDKEKISIIFSSSYPNNPASMFGHLFLKIGSGKLSGLNDIGINYAAQVPTSENPLAFFYFGVFGGYEGHWSIQPYYEKINEYVKAENRDLWEYNLNMTTGEIDLLIRHLWELETASVSPYYFFDENCAYQIARIVESIKTEWNISKYFIYAIPGEIIKNLFNESHYVKSISYRPSLRKKLLNRVSALNEVQRSQVSEFISNGKLQEVSEKAFNIYQLNVLNAYFDYQRQIKKGQLTNAEVVSWEQVRNLRSRMSDNISENEIISYENPERGHDSFAFGILSGAIGNDRLAEKNYLGVELRSAYHDLLNLDEGFLPFSQILFPYIQVYHLDKSTYINKVNFIDIISLNPINMFDKDLSWKVNFQLERMENLNCHRCVAFNWNGGLGFAYQPLNNNSIFYNFLDFKFLANSEFENGYHPLLGLSFGGIYAFKNAKLNLGGAIEGDVISSKIEKIHSSASLQLGGSFFLKKNAELRPQINLKNMRFSDKSSQESELKINYFIFFK